jgi:uncharacterized surface protein with fasciclin (FAS1) repeats
MQRALAPPSEARGGTAAPNRFRNRRSEKRRLEMFYRMLLASLFALGMVLGGAVAQEEPEEPADYEEAAEEADVDHVFSVLATDPELSVFARALEEAGFAEVLDPMTEWTVFAPINAAVSDETTLAAPEALSSYVIQGAFSYDDLYSMAESQGGMATLTTFDDQLITIELSEHGTLVLAGVANIVAEDMAASNGFVHAIDATITASAAAPAAAGG